MQKDLYLMLGQVFHAERPLSLVGTRKTCTYIICNFRQHFFKVLVQIPYSQQRTGGLNVKNHHLLIANSDLNVKSRNTLWYISILSTIHEKVKTEEYLAYVTL